MTKPELYTGRVLSVRVRALHGVPEIELDVDGTLVALTPTNVHSLIRKLNTAAKFAEGR